MNWLALHPHAAELMGFVPGFLSEDDERPAREQLDENYAHGGGWSPFPGFAFDAFTGALTYPGDPPIMPVAVSMLRLEMIAVYPHALVAIVQPDGSFEVARMD